MEQKNNKILIHACCGICSGYPISLLKEMGYEPVVYFCNPNLDTKEEFDACIQKVENDYESVKAKAMEQYEMIKKEYSFERRVEELLEIAERYKK